MPKIMGGGRKPLPPPVEVLPMPLPGVDITEPIFKSGCVPGPLNLILRACRGRGGDCWMLT